MIMFRVSDGLGNQLFQYAAARAAGKLLNTEVQLDRYFFRRFKKRAFLLDQFETTLPTVDRGKLGRHFGPVNMWRYRRLNLPGILERKSSGPFETILRDWSYYKGYWQRPEIAEMVRPELGQEFQIKADPSPRYRDWIAEAEATRSVSVHVRRTDYLEKSRFGTCAPAYYERALDLLVHRVGEVEIFLFSDDIGWAKEHIRLPGRTRFIDGSGYRPLDDFRLMSRCAHHIIANSTFSWWSAWLRRDQSGIVICPEPWTFGGSHRWHPAPDDWIRLPMDGGTPA
jgi:hypothetical protein